MQDFTGSGAIVTGGASGLGEATAWLLAESGLKVTIFDLNEQSGQELAAAIGAFFARVDVSDPQSVAKGIKTAEKAHGVARVLVKCAGIGGAAKTVSRGAAHDLDLFGRTLRVNLMGTFSCASQVAARMITANPIDDDGARRNRQHGLRRGVRRTSRTGGLPGIQGRDRLHDTAHGARSCRQGYSGQHDRTWSVPAPFAGRTTARSAGVARQSSPLPLASRPSAGICANSVSHHAEQDAERRNHPVGRGHSHGPALNQE